MVLVGQGKIILEGLRLGTFRRFGVVCIFFINIIYIYTGLENHKQGQAPVASVYSQQTLEHSRHWNRRNSPALSTKSQMVFSVPKLFHVPLPGRLVHVSLLKLVRPRSITRKMCCILY